MNGLVSVIMPAYNAEDYIVEAVNSILAQTYSNLELIVIDDKSTDETISRLENISDPRLKILYNHQNRGIAYTTNIGLQEAAGKFIALMDDDDVAEKDRLALQVSYLNEHPEIDILGGMAIKIDEAGKILKYGGVPRRNPKYIRTMLLFRCLDFWNGTTMMRKAFIDKNELSYHENCYGMQDYYFFIEASKVGNISSIDQFLLRKRIHSQNETKIQKSGFGEERARRYAEFQRISLQLSGFALEEEELHLINEMLPEQGAVCRSLEQWNNLYLVFYKLLSQGKAMGIDFLDELNHYCKSVLAQKMMNLNLFDSRCEMVTHDGEMGRMEK